MHPKQGYLYYTDWAEKAACVGRSLLDGSNHSIIVNSLNAKNQIQVIKNVFVFLTLLQGFYIVDFEMKDLYFI